LKFADGGRIKRAIVLFQLDGAPWSPEIKTPSRPVIHSAAEARNSKFRARHSAE